MNWYEDYGVNVADADDQQRDLFCIFDDLYDNIKTKAMKYWHFLMNALKSILIV